MSEKEYTFSMNSKEVQLTTTEYMVLVFLASNPNPFCMFETAPSLSHSRLRVIVREDKKQKLS